MTTRVNALTVSSGIFELLEIPLPVAQAVTRKSQIQKGNGEDLAMFTSR